MRSIVRKAVFLAPLMALLLPFPASPVQGSHPANALQPGDIANTPAGQCTLNFVFDGGGKVYFGIAAHCGEVGQSVSSTAYSNFGTIVYDDDVSTDFALIEVKSTVAPHVNAAVRGHPGRPTGVTNDVEVVAGDLVQFSGYGLGFGSTSATQEQRVGVITLDSERAYCAQGPTIFGDSGGPVYHVSTGKALGFVSALSGLCNPTGSTIAYAVSWASSHGFPVTLRTA